MEDLFRLIGRYLWPLLGAGILVGAIGVLRGSSLLSLLAALILFVSALPLLPSGWLALPPLVLAGGLLYAALSLWRSRRSDRNGNGRS